jgi:murein DD-endopeptidase MepM/ murein hydrolase activator NlpD
VKALQIGPNLKRFLDQPLGGEQMDLSLPFYDESIRLGTDGGGWIRKDRNNGKAFHAGTDFNTWPETVFDVCSAAEGRVLAIANERIVISHKTDGDQEFRTVYVHIDLASVSKVVGDPIRRGEYLGRISSTTTFLHLHFGVSVQVQGYTYFGQSIPPLWHFIDPWGVYDIREGNYLPNVRRRYESHILGVTHTVQWRTQPLSRTIPISRLTDGYHGISSIQVRVRRNENNYGTFPPEHEQFLVWLKDDPDFYMVPMSQASNLTSELELINLLREAFYHKRKVKLEYRYAGNLRYIMAAWAG